MRRYAEHPFWQAVGILLLAYIVVVWVVPVLPGSAIVPKSVVLQYMVTVLVGVLIYVSDNEERWSRFKEPIQAVLIEPRLRVVRAAVLAGVTALVGLVAYGQVKTSVAAPPNLRSIHPAPPAEITFRGKAITLTGLENPLRLLPELSAVPRRPSRRPGALRLRLQPAPRELPGQRDDRAAYRELRVLARREGRARAAARGHAVELGHAGVGGLLNGAGDLVGHPVSVRSDGVEAENLGEDRERGAGSGERS